MTAETETARMTGTTPDAGARGSWELAADPGTLLAAVERIRSAVETGVDEGEASMTLPAATVGALAETGLLRMKLPRVLGGLEADLLTQYEVIEAMAYVDASAAWCLMIGASSIAIPGAFLPDAAVSEVFRDHRVPLAASSFVPTGSATQADGGYILSGRWPFASGVRHSDWLNVGALVPDQQSEAPRHLLFVLPTSQARIHDNWDTIGLRGTGSCDLSLEDVFVPVTYAVDLLTGEPARGGPLYQLGVPAFFAYEHMAFAIGVARRALDTIVEMAPSKHRGMPPSPLAERGALQRDLAELDLRLRAARALALECNRKAWNIVVDGQKPDVQMQADLRAVAVFATDVALDVVRQAYRYAGGGAVYKPNVLERAMRDLHTASQHLVVSTSAYEIHGQAILGMTDLHPLG
jgi:alkylation response protein AidB-like acyl-CoA dehydrogenase